MDNKRGFTLIELLIVVVIIGILAAIAIPRFSETRERAFQSSVTSDLRNIQTLQEQFYFDNQDATTGAYTYASEPDLDFNFSTGVTASSWTADADGYEITASHGSWAGSCTLEVDRTGSSLVCSDAETTTPDP